jgi:hypothetical protein
MADTPSWEYIASFFDAEGSACLSVSTNGVIARCTLTNQDVDLLEDIRSVTGGNIGQGGHTAKNLVIYKKEEILRFIDQVRPFIRHRRWIGRLDIIYEWVKLEVGKGPKPNEKHLRNRVVRARLYEKFKELDAPGNTTPAQ